MLTPHDSASGSLGKPANAAAEVALRHACHDLERRIGAGEAARAEAYLAMHPEFDAEQALDLIFVEYAARRDRGEAPPHEEFFARFPNWHRELERHFQIDELLDESSLAHGGQTATASRFRITRLLARGGIGQVMRAIDTELNREVAVKELQPAHTADDAVRERFLREAEITGKLEHPGIVPVYGLGSDAAGRPFYAMRLVRGQSFQDAVQGFHQRAAGPHPFFGIEFQKLLRRFLHVCETVAFAHSRGIVHRDLKPANILLGPFGETLVVDWGLARATGEAGAHLSGEAGAHLNGEAGGHLSGKAGLQVAKSPVAHWSSELTQVSGELIGTPAFMSPEQASGAGHHAGPESDVYGLGATLYMLLTGRAPFVGSDLVETLQQVAAGSFPRPREINRKVPSALEAICLKTMAQRPTDRYPTPCALADDLEHWLADEPTSAGPESIIARLGRWGRRHRTPVVAAALTLVVITIVSVVAAIRINSERLRADRDRDEAKLQRLEAIRQRAEAERERVAANAERNEANRQRTEANRRNARLAFDRGIALTRDHEHGEGMLWFARALALAPRDDDAALRRVILTNLDAARHYVLRRRATFATPNVGRMAFSPDGKRLVTTSIRGLARLWDVESGAMLYERKLQSGGSASVVALHAFQDGSALVALDSSLSISVLRLPADGALPIEPEVTLRHDERIFGAAFNPDGTVLAAGSRTNGPSKTRLWRVSDGQRLTDFGHPTTVGHIVFRPKTRELATIGGDGRVRLWRTPDEPSSDEEKTPIREIKVEARRVRMIAFTPDGKRLLVGDTTGTVSDWDANTGRRLPDLANESGMVTAIAVASDGQTVLAAWDTGRARVWSLASQATFCELLRLDRHAGRLTFRPRTRQLLIATEQQAVMLWDVPNPARLAPVLSQSQITAIAFSPDGQRAITGSRDTTARLRATATGTRFGLEMRHADVVSQVGFRPDGAVVLTASLDGTARLWNAQSGKAQGQVMNHRPGAGGQIQVEAAVFSPDGKFVITGDSRGVLRTWNGDTGEVVAALQETAAAAGSVESVCFNSSGDRIVAGFTNGQVGVWDSRTGKLLWPPVRHVSRVRTVAFSPDGRLVLSAGNDETARFWNADNGQSVGAEMRHRGQVFVARFSPDGRLAVTGGFDTTVRLWEVPSGRPIGEPMRHEGVVAAASFSRDGMRLVTGGTRDRTARLWDVATFLPLASPLEHDDDVFAVAIHPDGHVAISGRFWRLPTPLPDDTQLIELWAQLATQRRFTAGNNVEWLSATDLAATTSKFHSLTGKSWQEWADGDRAASSSTTP